MPSILSCNGNDTADVQGPSGCHVVLAPRHVPAVHLDLGVCRRASWLNTQRGSSQYD